MKKKFVVPQPLLSQSPHGAPVFKLKHMLSSISWQQYLAAVLVLSFSYYVYILLRYYQTDIKNLFNRRSSRSPYFADMQNSIVGVMGKARQDDGVSIGDPENLQFGEASPDDLEIYQDQASTTLTPTQLTPDYLQELVNDAKSLIHAFKEVDDKEKFLSLLKIQIGSYLQVSDEIDRAETLIRILHLTKNELPFSVDLQDLQPVGLNS